MRKYLYKYIQINHTNNKNNSYNNNNNNNKITMNNRIEIFWLKLRNSLS